MREPAGTLRLLSRWPEYEFTGDAFDVRGWAVASEGDARLGRVHDMVLDASGAPCYLDVQLADGRCVLWPIGQARVQAAEDVVVVSAADAARFAALPDFADDATQLTPEYEAALTEALGAGSSVSSVSVVPQLESMAASDDLHVAGGECDPRGWPVLFADGEAAGVVRDLLVDTDAMKVRYFDCELRGGKRVLVPAVYARTDEDAEHVVVDAITADEALGMPAAGAPPLSAEDEERLHEVFTRGVTRGEAYRHPRYSAEHFYGARRPRMGERRGSRR